ncbi:MAG TPA: substrate-binding domain-containing protein [Rhizomicrobium sp.]|nr:substrate-binding domain-containing protein [Rhizomicrobium sp.]
MARLFRLTVAVVTAALTVMAFPKATFAQVKVMTSGGFAAALKVALPDFEKSTGISVIVIPGKSQGTGPDTIRAQLGRGVSADVVILSREGLNDLVSDGRTIAHSDADLAKTPLGVAVKAGAPKPDISTVEAFKNTLLQARSITYPSSTTGIYMATKLFPQLGIAKELAAKSNNAGVAAVAKGDTELAIQPVSEILHVPGTDFAGTIPEQIQYISVFSAALVAGTGKADQARQLIGFLASEKARDAIRASGMEPVGPH